MTNTNSRLCGLLAIACLIGGCETSDSEGVVGTVDGGDADAGSTTSGNTAGSGGRSGGGTNTGASGGDASSGGTGAGAVSSGGTGSVDAGGADVSSGGAGSSSELPCHAPCIDDLLVPCRPDSDCQQQTFGDISVKCADNPDWRLELNKISESRWETTVTKGGEQCYTTIRIDGVTQYYRDGAMVGTVQRIGSTQIATCLEADGGATNSYQNNQQMKCFEASPSCPAGTCTAPL